MPTRKADLQGIYRARFSEEAKEAKARLWKVLVETYFQRWVQPSETVLDLGCGHGEFLNFVRCGRKIGVDLNPESRGNLPPDVEFHVGPASRLDFLPDHTMDLVFVSNLMEHLADKGEVEQMLQEAGRVLKSDGHLVAMGPNLRYLPGEYWDFWDHRVPITDRSLAEILRALGFRLLDCIPRFLPYTTRSALPISPGLLKCYLKLPLVWPLLGRQFLIRVTRGGSDR